MRRGIEIILDVGLIERKKKQSRIETNFHESDLDLILVDSCGFVGFCLEN